MNSKHYKPISYNLSVLQGRIVKKPMVSEFNKNGELKKRFFFVLAVDNKFSEDADFIPCILYAKQKRAEHFEHFAEKGVPFLVRGKIKQNKFENKSEIIVEVDDFEVGYLYEEERRNKEYSVDSSKKTGKTSKSKRRSGDIETSSEPELEEMDINI